MRFGLSFSLLVAGAAARDFAADLTASQAAYGNRPASAIRFGHPDCTGPPSESGLKADEGCLAPIGLPGPGCCGPTLHPNYYGSSCAEGTPIQNGECHVDMQRRYSIAMCVPLDVNGSNAKVGQFVITYFGEGIDEEPTACNASSGFRNNNWSPTTYDATFDFFSSWVDTSAGTCVQSDTDPSQSVLVTCPSMLPPPPVGPTTTTTTISFSAAGLNAGVSADDLLAGLGSAVGADTTVTITQQSTFSFESSGLTPQALQDALEAAYPPPTYTFTLDTNTRRSRRLEQTDTTEFDLDSVVCCGTELGVAPTIDAAVVADQAGVNETALAVGNSKVTGLSVEVKLSTSSASAGDDLASALAATTGIESSAMNVVDVVEAVPMCNEGAATDACARFEPSDTFKLCFHDPTCAEEDPLLGCGAGGSPLCRYCGLDGLPPCPSVVTVSSAKCGSTPSLACYSSNSRASLADGNGFGRAAMETCYFDETCLDPEVGGLGCNAGGEHECRFCGFKHYPDCPINGTEAGPGGGSEPMPVGECGALPEATCTTNQRELCYKDLECDDPEVDHLGCNAAGNFECRFCGFGHFKDCPSVEEANVVNTLSQLRSGDYDRESSNRIVIK